MHIDNEGKDILILGIGPTQGLDDTMLAAEAQNIQLIFQDQIENFVWVFIVMKAIVFYLLMLQTFKARESEIKKYFVFRKYFRRCFS